MFSTLDGYKTSDIVYQWKKENVIIERKTIAQFVCRESQLGEQTANYSTGKQAIVSLIPRFLWKSGLYLTPPFPVSIYFCYGQYVCNLNWTAAVKYHHARKSEFSRFTSGEVMSAQCVSLFLTSQYGN